MERKNIIIASLLMFGALTTEAQTVKVNETEAMANGEMEFVVTADANINNYIATGFFVELPEGFSVAGVEGVKSNADQTERQYIEAHADAEHHGHNPKGRGGQRHPHRRLHGVHPAHDSRRHHQRKRRPGRRARLHHGDQ